MRVGVYSFVKVYYALMHVIWSVFSVLRKSTVLVIGSVYYQ